MSEKPVKGYKAFGADMRCRDGRDTDSMEPRMPTCYGTGAVCECPARCPHRDWCWLDYASGHAIEAGDGDADAA